MEKQYVKPDMEITEFETEDVISTSGGGPRHLIEGDNGNGASYPGDWHNG